MNPDWWTWKGMALESQGLGSKSGGAVTPWAGDLDLRSFGFLIWKVGTGTLTSQARVIRCT